VPHACTEDQLVEQPAIGLFAGPGWTVLSALEEVFGANGTLPRETKGEVVLMSRLRVIDWENPENNDCLLVRQSSVTGALP
jgi:hypothetical protein